MAPFLADGRSQNFSTLIIGLAADSAGNLYISDNSHHKIFKLSNGILSTFAGTGTASTSGDGGPALAAAVQPAYPIVDNKGNLFFLDSSGIREISNGIISTIPGTATPFSASPPVRVYDMTLDLAGNFYMADWIASRVWIMSPNSSTPIGSFDTPVDNLTNVSGAIPVTGWALDPIGISKVEVWREPVGNEPVASNHLVFIGDAVQVAGARPDVQAKYTDMPFNDRAGWGYMLLTNFLPSLSGPLGNGTYKLHFIASNNAGNEIDLGTHTITVDNIHASKPFGTIDTPEQGATISGNAYVNFGWALTQNPYCVPADGHTITIYLDGVPIGHPTYNQNRADISTLFPGLCNSNGAIGFSYLDSTHFSNGVHNIAWTVTDSQGRTDGIGSRYFNVQNAGGAAALEQRSFSTVKAQAVRREIDYHVEVEELDRIELNLGAISIDSLPIGSALQDGIFYWQLGPGFLGDYQLRFKRSDGTPAELHVKVHPKTFRAR